jgi:uncharacterized BrkB/YihY/UPF0761 family membrane protein
VESVEESNPEQREPSAEPEAAGAADGDASRGTSEEELAQTPAGRRALMVAALEARSKALSERAQAERGSHSSVDAVFEMVDRDVEVGGGIIAGALAYRMFIWLLPFALVLVAGFGLLSQAASDTPQQAARTMGLAGIVSHSVASTAGGANRWYALLIGIPILLVATRSVLRVLIGAHRLVWADVRAAAPKPTVGSTFLFLCLILCFFAASVFATFVRERASGIGLIASVLTVVPFIVIWLVLSAGLPHRGACSLELVPGAVLFGVGIELFHLGTVYLLAPWLESKQGTYGALGVASALLVGLYIASRIVVLSAVVNATLWERRQRARSTAQA